MTVFTAIAFATFFLENDHFLTLYEGFENFTLNFSAFHGRRTDFYIAVGIKKKHFVESDCVALLCFFAEIVNIQEFAGFGFELALSLELTPSGRLAGQ